MASEPRTCLSADTIGIARESGLGAGAVPAVPPGDAMGINSRGDLAIVGLLALAVLITAGNALFLAAKHDFDPEAALLANANAGANCSASRTAQWW